MDRITRREFFRRTGEAIGAAVLGNFVLGCQVTNESSKTKPPPLPNPELTKTPDITESALKIREEIKRLVGERYNDDSSFVKKVYSEKPIPEISSLYKYPVFVGEVLDNITYSRLTFGNPEISPKPRFKYTLNGKSVNWETVDTLPIFIFFSKLWLDAKSDEVKAIAMEKEAMTVVQIEEYCRFAYNTYKMQGEITKIDPTVTDKEIAHTLGLVLLTDNPEVRKLFDYASYLPLLKRIGNILQSGNAQAIQDVSVPNLATIYRRTKERGIQFENITFGTAEFYRMAFDNTGPWAKFVLDPSNPGPASSPPILR